MELIGRPGHPNGATAAMASVWVVERFTVGICRALESVFGWAARKDG